MILTRSTIFVPALVFFTAFGAPTLPGSGSNALFQSGFAVADDDDGGDDDGGDDDDGGGVGVGSGRSGGDDDNDGPSGRGNPGGAIGRFLDRLSDDDDARPVRRQARRAVQRRAPPPPPEFVVAVPDDASLGTIEGLGYTIVARDRIDLIGSNIARLRPPSGVTLDAARAQILAAVAQSTVDLNTLYSPEELSCTDGSCAAFEMIGWQGSGSCTMAPTIGMIDTGVNATHPSLARGRVETISVVGQGRKAASKVHGTAVALLIAGDPASRTPGTLPEAKLIAAEAFHRTGAGEEAADVFDIVRGIETLADKDVDIVNMSFSGGENLLLEKAIAALSERKVPVVAAAGNAGPRSTPLFPAAYPQAVAVTAVDIGNKVYRQANAGQHIAFAAPGVRLWTAASVSGGRFRSGTSYAAPFVTSALAVKRAAHPEASVAELVSMLAADAIDLGEPGRDATFGHGLIKMPACAGAARPIPASAGPATSGASVPDAIEAANEKSPPVGEGSEPVPD